MVKESVGTDSAPLVPDVHRQFDDTVENGVCATRLTLSAEKDAAQSCQAPGSNLGDARRQACPAYLFAPSNSQRANGKQNQRCTVDIVSRASGTASGNTDGNASGRGTFAQRSNGRVGSHANGGNSGSAQSPPSGSSGLPFLAPNGSGPMPGRMPAWYQGAALWSGTAGSILTPLNTLVSPQLLGPGPAPAVNHGHVLPMTPMSQGAAVPMHGNQFMPENTHGHDMHRQPKQSPPNAGVRNGGPNFFYDRLPAGRFGISTANASAGGSERFSEGLLTQNGATFRSNGGGCNYGMHGRHQPQPVQQVGLKRPSHAQPGLDDDHDMAPARKRRATFTGPNEQPYGRNDIGRRLSGPLEGVSNRNSWGLARKGTGGPHSVFISTTATGKTPQLSVGPCPAAIETDALGKTPQAAVLKSLPGAKEEAEDTELGNELTIFNELCQKGIAGLRSIKWQYNRATVPKAEGTGEMWECIGTTAAMEPGVTDKSVTVSKAVTAKSQKRGRRLVAGLLLQELVSRKLLTEKCIATKGTHLSSSARSQLCPNPDGTGPITNAQAKEIADAVCILNQLWQKEHFLCRPKRTETAVSSGATGRWKSTVLVKTKKFGDVEVSSILSQKTKAYQMACFKAVKKLKETPLGAVIGRINVKAKPQANVSTVAPGSEVGRTHREMDQATGKRLNTEVENDGDLNPVVPGPVPVGEFEDLLSAISNNSVVVARSVSDCSTWVSSNISDGAQLGLYIDSPASRTALLSDAKECNFSMDVDNQVLSAENCYSICLSTDSSVLVVAAGFMDVPAASSAKKNKAEHSMFNTWIPNAVKFVLERAECSKYGVGLGEGILLLRFCHGIKCSGVTELGVSSTALLGTQGFTKFQFPTVRGLVRSWVGRGLEPFLERALTLKEPCLSSRYAADLKFVEEAGYAAQADGANVKENLEMVKRANQMRRDGDSEMKLKSAEEVDSAPRIDVKSGGPEEMRMCRKETIPEPSAKSGPVVGRNTSGNSQQSLEAAEHSETAERTEEKVRTAVFNCILPSVGITVACSAIQKRLEETGDTRRRKRHGQSDQHRSLYDRLVLPLQGDL